MPRLIVGIGDMKLSRRCGDTLVTFALGSCLGLTLYDPQARVGGLIHIALPDSAIGAGHPDFNPLKYIDTGIPLLFREAYKLGASKPFIRVKLAGCASLSDEGGLFNIGKRNHAAARKLLWKNNVLIEAEHCGDNVSRTLSLDIANGRVTLRIGGCEEMEL